jgi:hypothetical protein
MFKLIYFITATATAVKKAMQSLHDIISTIRSGLKDVERAIKIEIDKLKWRS